MVVTNTNIVDYIHSIEKVMSLHPEYIKDAFLISKRCIWWI